MPFAPDTVGADVEELHVRTAVVAFAQRLEKRAVFLEVDRVGVVRFDARHAFAAAGRVVTADKILEALAAGVEEPLGRSVIAAAVRVAGHHAHGHGSAARFPGGDDVVDEFPVERAFLRFGVGPVEADIHDRAGKARLAARAALLAHPALAGIGKERVHFAKLNADNIGLAGTARERGGNEQRRQYCGIVSCRKSFHRSV